jgi:D-lyxose ketol-isomerase
MLSRSEINRSIGIAKRVFKEFGVHLPPFASWSVEEWDQKGSECDEIRHCMLGWDVTDFGSGRFAEIGRTLFTLRNGTARKPGYGKSYAEKYILDPEGQRAPAHFHRGKMEDIINRGGGVICVQLTPLAPDGQRTDQPFSAQMDGQQVELASGEVIELRPGQSVCIPPRTIHQFWGKHGTGYTVSGEVSTVCDDWDDNCFLEPASRFPEIEEDEPRRAYLCNEYPRTR